MNNEALNLKVLIVDTVGEMLRVKMSSMERLAHFGHRHHF